jgi:sulfur carrier protein
MKPDGTAMTASGRIRGQANGSFYETAFGTSLEAFLKERGLALTRVVVERNGEALSPAEAKGTLLQDNDRLEIVKIVAGG